ncbi:hypothetical protein AALK14_14780 [Butyricimonas hominis]|uniref:hypothetical protein n=1 Tax=Butyricimonas TaxID=574697 RepID=UPI003513C361
MCHVTVHAFEGVVVDSRYRCRRVLGVEVDEAIDVEFVNFYLAGKGDVTCRAGDAFAVYPGDVHLHGGFAVFQD